MFRISCVITSKMKKNYTKALFESMKFFYERKNHVTYL